MSEDPIRIQIDAEEFSEMQLMEMRTMFQSAGYNQLCRLLEGIQHEDTQGTLGNSAIIGMETFHRATGSYLTVEKILRYEKAIEDAVKELDALKKSKPANK